MVGFRPEWEPWEAKRASLPPRPSHAVREARQDARLLLMVVRARFAEGIVPFEHTERLAEVAEDERVKVRQQRVAATLLGKVRGAMATRAVEALRQDGPSKRGGQAP